MPVLLTNGVSYSDFWRLTYGEMTVIAKRLAENHEKEEKKRMQNIACVSFFTAKLIRAEGSLPDSPAGVFPGLFGLTNDGKIPVENWEAGKERMKMLAEKINSSLKKKGA
jgi:hypothetical protein